MEAQRAPFPSEVDEFAADDRISYSKQLKTYVLEDEQGQEWEWLAAHSKWTQTVCSSRHPVHRQALACALRLNDPAITRRRNSPLTNTRRSLVG